MRGYIITRVFGGVVTLFIVAFIVFGLLNLTPGDPVAVLLGEGYTLEDANAIKHDLGMDRPLPERWVRWLGDIILRFDLGESIKSGRAVTDIIQHDFPVTLELAVFSVVLTVLVGVPLGVWSAVRQDRPDDYAMRALSIAFLSIPSFWIATMVFVLPVIWVRWAPPGPFQHFVDNPTRNLYVMIIPAAILAVRAAAVIMRITRSAVLEVLREDYVRTARAKGLASTVVMRRHILRNSLLPVLTIIGGQFAFLFSGAVVIETIFNLPGLGREMVVAIGNRDFPVIIGVNLIVGTMVVTTNLTVDLMYRVVDPRITY